MSALIVEGEDERRKGQRRATCKEHQETMREIFSKIDKRLPIWAFLASIGIIGAAFSFITVIQKDGTTAAHNRMTSITQTFREDQKEIKSDIEKIKVDLKADLGQLNKSISELSNQQAVMLEQIRSIKK